MIKKKASLLEKYFFECGSESARYLKPLSLYTSLASDNRKLKITLVFKGIIRYGGLGFNNL